MTVTHNQDRHVEMPRAIAPFVSKCPPLLPGESETDYWDMFYLLMEDMAPATNMDWFVLADVAGLLWEVRRYSPWKGAILNIYRRSALETALRDTHRSGGAGFDDAPVLIDIARKEAEEWRTDPEKREVLNARLAEHGYDEVALNAGALLEALAPIAAIDRFLSSARAQLNAMLKQYYVSREFAERTRKAFAERLKAVESAPTPKQIGPN